MDIQTKQERKPGPKIGKYSTYTQSPYTVEVQSKYVQAKENHKVMYDEHGEMFGTYKIPKGVTIPVDIAKYSKLFKNSGMLIANLNEAAIKMFMYIHEKLPVNSDQMCITREEYLEYYGYAPTNKYTYYQAIEGLLRAGIMAKQAGSTVCYWINPNILFNGDRTKLKNIVVRPPDKPFNGPNDRT